MSRLNQLIGDGGVVDELMLRDQVVVLVSDGLPNGTALDAAADFLRPIRIQKLIIATPTASVQAVDRMHILADEMHVLGVTDNYMDVNHYYDVNDVPEHQTILRMLNETVLTWH